MKLFLRIFGLGFGLLLLTAVLIILSLLAGNRLPYQGDMAYISTLTGINQLYLMDVQRQFNFRLKVIFINDCCLTWSPDGKILTYVRDMSSDGSTDIFSTDFRSPTQRLTTVQGADLYPTYSPDGQQIAYMAYGYGNPEINLMNRDGSQAHALTGEKLITNINPHPVWSADGKSVLFSDFNNPDSLYAVPIDCVDPCENAMHTAFDTHGLPLMTTSFIALDPSRLFLAAFERTKKGGYGIYSLDTQSSTIPERLTINAGLASPAMAVYDHWIAFASGTTNLQVRVDDASLFVLDFNCIGSPEGCTGGIQKIASQIGAEDSISWSSDGKWLAFVTLSGGLSHLNLLDTTCLQTHRDCSDYIHPMPVTSVRYIRPAWRPPIQ